MHFVKALQQVRPVVGYGPNRRKEKPVAPFPPGRDALRLYLPHAIFLLIRMALRTGEIAEAAGVNVETVRYYERRGLIPEPPRDARGHRRYGGNDVRRLHFIKRAQKLGFSLDEVEVLLSLRARPDAPNAEVKAKTEAKIEATAAKIRDLQGIKATLEELSAACDGEGTTSECPILDALELPPKDE